MTKEPSKELTQSRMKTVEAGLAYYQQIQQERDDIHRDLKEADQTIAHMKAEVEGLKHQIAMIESRVASCIADRDQAVEVAIGYRTTLEAITAILHKALVSTEITEVDEEEHGMVS